MAQQDTALKKGVRLGRVAGVQVALHWSVLVVVGLIAVLLATSELPALHSGDSRTVYWLVGVGASVVFMLSLAAHELAHALVARHFGMRAERMTLWMLGGLTELEGEPASPRVDAWVAGAGPLATIVLGGVFVALAAVSGHTVVGAAFAWLAVMSAILAAFNLLPGAPLDGGRLLRAIVWRVTDDRSRAIRIAATSGRFLGAFLVALGVLAVLAGDAMGIWLALIGWFILSGAAGERYAVRLDQLAGLTAQDVMVSPGLTFPSWWTVEMARSHIEPSDATQPAFPIVDVDGVTVGAVTLAELQRVVTPTAERMRVDQVPAASSVPIVPAGTGLSDVARAMTGKYVRVSVVIDEFRAPIGVIDSAILARAAQFAEFKRTTPAH